MSIRIRDTLEAIAIISAMIAVIVVPHPAKASMEQKVIKQLSNSNSSNSRAQPFPTSDVPHGFLHSIPSRAVAYKFSKIT